MDQTKETLPTAEPNQETVSASLKQLNQTGNLFTHR